MLIVRLPLPACDYLARAAMGKPSLICDFMELYRYLLDVPNSVLQKTHTQRFRLENGELVNQKEGKATVSG